MDCNQRDGGNNDKGMLYISEPKFTRERYIVVAAIDIMTIFGN
jgi:hypothetical protein